VLARFSGRGIAAADIGEITADHRVVVSDGQATETLWDFAREPLLGCVRSEALA
jgi:selenophosphate synthetase-related protein